MSDLKIKNTPAKDYLLKGSFDSPWEACMAQIGVHLECLYYGVEMNELKQKQAIKSHEKTGQAGLNVLQIFNKASLIKIEDHTVISGLLGSKPQKDNLM